MPEKSWQAEEALIGSVRHSLGLIVLALCPLAGCGWFGGQGPKPLQVSTAVLEPQQFRELGDYVATLEAVNQVQLAALADGRVVELPVEEGQEVEEGEVLLRRSSNVRRAELIRAQAELSKRRADVAAVEADLERDKRNFERYTYLAREGAANALDLDSYRASYLASQAKLEANKDLVEAAEAGLGVARTRLDYKTVRAPISGQVSDLSVKVGDVVKERDPFTSIVRNDRLYSQITIPVTMAERTRPGLPVWLLDPTNGVELAKGELKFVDPDVKVATQGLLAKAEFANPGNRLRSGMRVRTLVGFGSSQQLAVPFDAVIRSAGQSFVYVIGPARELNAKQRQYFTELKDNTPVAIKRAVTLGPLQNSCYPVLSGLKAGEQLISSDLLSLRQGTAVKAKESSPEVPICRPLR